MSTYLLLIASIIKIIPIVLEMIRDGRIKEATTQEVLGAFETEFEARWAARIAAARAAGAAVGEPGSVSDPDPFDRSTSRTKGGAEGSK